MRLKLQQMGQSSVEYLVACTVIWTLVTLPIGGADSVLDLMLSALKLGYVRFSTALGAPS